MPYVRRRFFRRRGRPYRRAIRTRRRFRRSFKRRGHLRTTRIKVRPRFISDKAYLKLRWNYVQAVSSSGGNAYELILRGNSIYDPNYYLGTTSVQGWEQWSNFYSKYQVTGSKIRVDYYSPSTNANPPELVAVLPSPETSPGAPASYTGFSTTNLQYITTARTKIATNYLASQKVTIRHYMTTQKIFGRKLTEMDDTISDISDNPIQQWYWHVLVKPMVGDSNASGWINVQVTYYVNLSKKDVDVIPQI